MIENKDAQRNLIIPKWISIDNIDCKEYEYPRSNIYQYNDKLLNDIENEKINFNKEPNLIKACNLLSSGIIINDTSIQLETAKYIETFGELPAALKMTIEKILKKCRIENNSYNEKINHIRNNLKQHNKNAMLWIELGRLYTIKGLNEKATKCINIATQISNDNRFIIRAAARYYIHINAPDIALHIVRNALKYSNDPWLRSLDLNCQLLVNNKINKKIEYDFSNLDKKYNYYISELLASIGIVKMKYGDDKKAKKYFREAWKDPAETVVANAEWVLRNKYPQLETECFIDYNKSSEASAWNNYYKINLEKAMEYATEWSLEEPYSTHPFSCGSSIACTARDFNKGIEYALNGLKANKNDALLMNNLAYSYLKLDNINDASKILDLINLNKLNKFEDIYISATTGLLLYKIGKIEVGRKYYLDAYNKSKNIGDKRISSKALLCLAEAEIEANSIESIEYAKRALKESDKINEPSIEILRNIIKSKMNIITI